MGEWAKTIFQQIADREGIDHARIQKEVLDRQQLLASAPSLWETLIEGIANEANDLNEMRPGLATIKDQVQGGSPSLSISITSAAMTKRTLSLHFKPAIPAITYTVTQPQGPSLQALKVIDREFTFRVIGGEVWLYAEREMAVHDALKMLLAYLVA